MKTERCNEGPCALRSSNDDVPVLAFYWRSHKVTHKAFHRLAEVKVPGYIRFLDAVLKKLGDLRRLLSIEWEARQIERAESE